MPTRVVARRHSSQHGDHRELLWGWSGRPEWRAHYLGTLVIRHELNGELADDDGGHIGYHVVAPWRRLGHATRMLAAGLHVRG
jgi:predicted acetyltransferase